MEAKSIIHKGRLCYVCGREGDLELHHCLHGTANRRNADKFGLTVYLCPKHHRDSREGAHGNRKLDLYLIQEAQKAFENKVGSREDFIRVFGKNYL